MCREADRARGFVEVVVQQAAPEEGIAGDVRPAAVGEPGCFEIHRVELRDTFTDPASGRVMWRFRARDAESVRMALRCCGIEYSNLRIEAAGAR